MTVFWDVAPCNLVEIYRRFRGVYYLHRQQALVMEAAGTSKISVKFYQITRRSEDMKFRSDIVLMS
jgi:hypothetical protein